MISAPKNVPMRKQNIVFSERYNENYFQPTPKRERYKFQPFVFHFQLLANLPVPTFFLLDIGVVAISFLICLVVF